MQERHLGYVACDIAHVVDGDLQQRVLRRREAVCRRRVSERDIDVRRGIDDVEAADPLEVVEVPNFDVAVLDNSGIGGIELDMHGHLICVRHDDSSRPRILVKTKKARRPLPGTGHRKQTPGFSSERAG